MKVAVFGASGLVGRSLRALLTELNIEWIGTYSTNPFEDGIYLDVKDEKSIIAFFSKHEFTHCINCVAERNVDICEKDFDITLVVNARFAEILAEQCLKTNIYMLHISTDYVFDGSSAPYLPTSECSPIQAYGKSKYFAEQKIQKMYTKSCIVRVPVLYTQNYRFLNETAVTMIAKKVMNKSKNHIEDNYYVRSPVFIDDFCVFLKDCLLKEKTGIFHFYNSKDRLTKYTIAKAIGEYLTLPIHHITPQVANTHQAGRPYDTTLHDLQYNRLDYPDTALQDGIAKCLYQFKHPFLSKEGPPDESIFYMIDLDGTLLDSEKLHYTSYQKAFGHYNLDFCSWDEYICLLSVETYCREKAGLLYEDVKKRKQTIFYNHESIDFISGAEEFLRWLLHTEQNFVIVTNTTRNTVNFFKEKVPLLQEVKQWVVREDVVNPKPNSEPYSLALQLYYKNEQYKIGIENTLCGFNALKEITPIIYIVGGIDSIPQSLAKEDFYWISSLTDIFSNKYIL
jgi:S-adenosylmethionine synthetase